MKQILVIMFIVFFSFAPLMHVQAQAQNTSTSGPLLSPETKAFLIMCGYGTVGGGLLGLASLAFGGGARNIAQGASVGLYAGILFGAYVIYSHDPSNAAPPSQVEGGAYDFGAALSIKSPEFIASLSSQNSSESWFVPFLNYQF